MSRLSRRRFLHAAAGLAAGAYASGRTWAANEKLRTAHVGVGGMQGMSDLQAVASHPGVEVAALCDVDGGHLAKAAERYPAAARFADYREMLDALAGRIDAVTVTTPDHTHAPAAMGALQRGLPVYCQKPLTHEVHEARRLREVAEERGLVTQMGTQMHSSAQYRQAKRIIRDGVIGKVGRVFAWSSKNWGFDGADAGPASAPPAEVDWNLWLGTAAERPYVAGAYHPINWRKFVDFGTGTLGDMGVHIFDTPYDALELTAPTWVKTTCRPPTGVGHPTANLVEYEFPGTAHTTGALRWTWYDGNVSPPTDLPLPEGVQVPGEGSLFVGEEGMMLLPHPRSAQLFPAEKFADYRRPEAPGSSHYHEWIDACLHGGATGSRFAYAGRLTEALLLGVVANRFPGQRLAWDAESMSFPDSPEATALLRRPYRDGFAVAGL